MPAAPTRFEARGEPRFRWVQGRPTGIGAAGSGVWKASSSRLVPNPQMQPTGAEEAGAQCGRDAP
jgi:hypothetical protein